MLSKVAKIALKIVFKLKRFSHKIQQLARDAIRYAPHAIQHLRVTNYVVCLSRVVTRIVKTSRVVTLVVSN